MEFERILFAVDLSEQSRRAAPFVKALATRFGSEVVMLYVLELPPSWSVSQEAATWGTLINSAELKEQKCKELQEFLGEDFGEIRTRRVMAEGDAAQQILRHAQVCNASLIMMPTHGYGPFRSLLLGSVTAKVLHDAVCPVWTGVHRQEAQAAPPERQRRILCAVDTAPKDAQIVKWAADIAKQEGAEVCLVHAIHNVPSYCRTYAGRGLDDCVLQSAHQQLRQLQETSGTNLDTSIQIGVPATVVHNSAAQWQADLVVIGRGAIQKPLGRLRSNAYAIIRESPCPVVSV